MLREELLKLIEALPPGCRVVGVGPDCGGYDCFCSGKIEVVTDSSLNLSLLGCFETEDVRDKYWRGIKKDYSLTKEEYHQLREITNKPISATEVCRRLQKVAPGNNWCFGLEASSIPNLTLLRTKLTDPVCNPFRDMITWDKKESSSF